MPRRRQHHKGKKRPRAWHRSLASSRQYYRMLKRLEESITPTT